MNPKIQVLLGFVVLATAQSVPISPFYSGLQGIGIGDDVLTGSLTGGDVFNRYMTNDLFDVDRYVLKKLVKLDIVNRPLVKKLLVLDIVERKVVGDLARGINDVIIKKGKLYPLTLWDRVLKIKGYDTVMNRNIEDHWVETEMEEKEILRDLIKVDTIDRQLVTSLLFTDVVERKIVADLAYVINDVTIKRGKNYPIVLLDKVLKINSGITGGFNRFGDVDMGFGYNKLGLDFNMVGLGGFNKFGFGDTNIGFGNTNMGYGYNTLGLGFNNVGLGLGFTNRGFNVNDFNDLRFTNRFGLGNDLTRTLGVNRMLF